MRTTLLLLPLLAWPAAAAAQPAPPPPIDIPPELTDPATAERIGGMMEALSRAFLNLPVGEIEAAAEGRQPTQADRARTVRDIAGPGDIDRQMAEVRPAVEQSMKAFARALPAMSRALAQAAAEVERAVANMPRPDYPRR